jgi:pimeloyl-ACP methyl ester carboxylesterase
MTGCTPLIRYDSVVAELPDDELVSVGAQRVHVKSWGAGEETLVLLHGFASSSFAFETFAPRVAEGRRVVAIDLNGFGYTERPSEVARYSLQGQADLVLGVMDELGVERASLLGHSYGGYLAMQLSQDAPERVDRLILVSPALHMDAGGSGLLRLAPVRWAVYPLVRLLISDPVRLRLLLARAYHRQDALTEEVVAAYRKRLLVEGLFRAYRGFGASMTSPTGDRMELKNLRKPTLLVAGEQDQVIPIRVFERVLEEAGPRVTAITLSDCGHSAPEEQPGPLAEAVQSFLRDR